jgi:hypothetical protein
MSKVQTGLQGAGRGTNETKDKAGRVRPSQLAAGTYLTLALPPGGKGKRTFQCFDCDGFDPLKSDQVIGWLKGELAPLKDDPRS